MSDYTSLIRLAASADGVADSAPITGANPLPTLSLPAAPANTWGYAPGSGGVVPSTGLTAAKAAAAAGIRNYVMSAQISHAALGASVELIIQDGATPIWRGTLGTAATDAGGFTINFDPPLRGSAATALNYTFSAITTGGVYVNLQGFTGA